MQYIRNILLLIILSSFQRTKSERMISQNQVKRQSEAFYVKSFHIIYAIPEDFIRLFFSTIINSPQKGGDPSPRSRRDTLLRLHPSHLSYPRRPHPLRVWLPTSSITDSHGVTGGVYNTRERIHPDILIRDYQRFQLHRVELQTLIRTGTSFKRLASYHYVATRCTGHCSTPVALDVRGMMI